MIQKRKAFVLFVVTILLVTCTSKKQHAVVKPDISKVQSSDTLNWKAFGPFGAPIPMAPVNGISPHGTGRFMCVNVHPDNDKDILIGHATSGVFRSLDGGITWKQTMHLGFASGVFKIVRFKANPKHLIAATAMDVGNSRQYGYGLIESFDGGESWQRNGLKFDPQEYMLDQSRDVVITDAKKEKSLVSITSHRVYLSNDAGVTWQNVYDSEYNLKHIVVSPHDPQTILITGNGILLSLDGGYTFNDITAEVSKSFGLKNGVFCLHHAAFSLKHPGKVYFVSQNQSVHFLESDVSDIAQTKLLNRQIGDVNISRLAMNLFQENGNEIVLIGTTRLYKSQPNSSNFTQWSFPLINNPLYMHDDINDIFIDAKNKVYVCNDGGVDVYNAELKTWKSLTNASVNLNASLMFGFDKNSNNSIMAGTQDNGVIRYSLGQWYCSDIYGDGGRVVAMDDSLKFSVGYAQMNYITTDGGKRFDYAHAGSEKTGHDFRLSYQKLTKTVYIANMHLYKKTGDKYFELVSANLEADKKIKAFWVDQKNEKDIWICKDDPTWGERLEKKLYHTTDGGLTWKDLTANLPILKWRSITDFYKNSKGEIAVTLEAFDKAETELNKVYVSYDGGKSFHNMSKGLPNLPVNCIVYAQGKWICGTNNGVFVYNNKTWMPLGKQFPETIVTELKYDELNHLLMASTFGRGLWGIALR